ncbi:MAG TPA: GAF domain-containing sensor histidine kinase, partial [Bdellovibrionota bacterium]|nr:GAF domain-containing sensor histidine kinase [Bdellovibrionota bacterium]
LKDYVMLEDPQLKAKGLLPYIRKGFEGEPTAVPAVLYDPNEIGVEGDARWVSAIIYPVRDPKGRLAEVVLMHQDITDRKRSEDAQRLLASVASVLGSSLDFSETLERIPRVAAGEFGGWCVVHLLDDAGGARVAAVEHADPAQKASLLEAYARGEQSPGPGGVLRTGSPELDSVLAEDSSLAKLGVRSRICVPLKARGRIFGTVTFMSSDRSYYVADLGLVGELVTRFALTLDNARLYRDAQDAVRARDEFLSIASHELKTPLTSLKLQLQSAERKRSVSPLDSVSKAIAVSNKQVDRLTKLVEDLLDVSRIQGGRLALERERVDLGKLVEQVADQFEPAIAAAHCRLELESEQDVVGRWDPERLEQVIINLLSNATKYAPGKPIRIRVRKLGAGARLTVQDFGPGIATERQELVFERFERAVPSPGVSGLGLGLFIVRSLVQAHGGKVELKSEPGMGSTFTVDLPLEPL